MFSDKPSFLEVARFTIALIIIVGGGAMLWFNAGLNSDAVIGVVSLAAGYYFGSSGVKSMQEATTKAAYNGAYNGTNGNGNGVNSPAK